MQTSLRSVSLACLLGFVLLTNTACPRVNITQSESGSWEDVAWAYELLYKGLLLNWIVDDEVPWPTRATIGLPTNIDFNGFTSNTTVGVFTIDGNFDRQISTLGSDWGFFVRAFNSMQSYIDMDNNNSLGSGDATINYNSQARRFDFNFNGTGYMGKGAYSLNLLPTFFNIKTGIDNALGDVPLDIFGANGVNIHRNLLFLNDATILPRIAYGDIGGPFRITSKIVGANPTGLSLVGSLRTFTDSGSPYPIELGGNTNSTFNWTMQPYSSRKWEPSNLNVTASVGWGLTQGNQYAVEYGVYDQRFKNLPKGKDGGSADRSATGTLVVEAGISPSGVSTRHVIHVTREPGGIDTAFSIVNPTSATANMTLILTEGTSERTRKTLTLGPRNAIARFFLEFFDLNPATFSGTLLIKSDTSLATTSLKTLHGAPSGSLPSGILEVR